MRSIVAVVLLAASLPLGGCCGVEEGPPPGTPGPAGAHAALQPDGSLTFRLTSGLPGRATRGRLSAPLIANITVFQHVAGAAYPKLDAERRDLVDREVYPFERLLAACQPKYPLIKLPVNGVPVLTEMELATNFNQVARCSYYEYGAKPYWIPQLIDDVDLCAAKLGAGWRLPTEADLAAFTETDFQAMRDTLTGVAVFDSINGFPMSWGVFYFGLKVYLRAGDGNLVYGDLNPGVRGRTSPLPATGDLRKDLLIDPAGQNAALRCLRNE